jgi:hypothetical protein
MTPSQKPPPQADIESMVDVSAAALGLTLSAEHKSGVLVNFARIAGQAQILMDFAIEEETEPAPVFRHDRP